jgi:hypothetical protein
MSIKVIARHRAAEAPKTKIATFDEWIASVEGPGAERRVVDGGSEVNGEEEEGEEEEHYEEPLEPRKRRRVDVPRSVCLVLFCCPR